MNDATGGVLGETVVLNSLNLIGVTLISMSQIHAMSKFESNFLYEVEAETLLWSITPMFCLRLELFFFNNNIQVERQSRLESIRLRTANLGSSTMVFYLVVLLG